MKQYRLHLLLAAALLAGAPWAAYAQTVATVAASAPAAAYAQGEVRKIDKAAGKITLRHGEITNLGMPPMTMVFRVGEPAWLDTLKEGDKVRFTADKVNGVYTVTAIEALRP